MLENAYHSNIRLRTVGQAVHARTVETRGSAVTERAGKAAERSLDGVLPHLAPRTHSDGSDKLRNKAGIALPQEQNALSEGGSQESPSLLGDHRAVLQKRGEGQRNWRFRKEPNAEQNSAYDQHKHVGQLIKESI